MVADGEEPAVEWPADLSLSAPDCIADQPPAVLKTIIDFDGYILGANLQLRALLGWSVQELTSVPYWELLHPADQDRAVERSQQMLLSGPRSLTDFEVRMLCRTGTYRHLRYNARSISQHERMYWVGIDVTEPESSEIAERVLVGSWDWDILTDTATWSPGMYEMHGLPSAPPHDLEAAVSRIHIDDQAAVARAIQHSLSTGEPYLADHRIVRPGEETCWLHSAGRVIPNANGDPERIRGITQQVTSHVGQHLPVPPKPR
jgi:PAS domain S-box-containing protein